MEESNYFSIIIPTLNEEKYLPKLLMDLTSQREKNFEVIVIDASSSDRTREKTLQYKKNFLLRFFTTDRKNVSYQRNLGANAAKGQYLIFLDADSRINASFTKSLKRFLLRNKGLLVLPYFKPDDSDPQIQFLFKLANAFTEFSQLIGKPISRVGCMVVEKHFFSSLRGFNEKLFIGEDYDLVKRAYKWGVKAKFANNIKIKYSLRRMRREGRLRYFYKSLVSNGHEFIKGSVKKKIFEYDMGGAAKNPGKDDLFFKQNIQKTLKQLKQFFTS